MDPGGGGGSPFCLLSNEKVGVFQGKLMKRTPLEPPLQHLRIERCNSIGFISSTLLSC